MSLVYSVLNKGREFIKLCIAKKRYCGSQRFYLFPKVQAPSPCYLLELLPPGLDNILDHGSSHIWSQLSKADHLASGVYAL